MYKPNSNIWICIDYRKLNAITCKNIYLIPKINKLLSRPAKAKFFIKFNIRATFNKICIDPSAEEYTTFYTYYGFYKYKVLLFGLTNKPATYQRYINNILINYLDNFYITYLDDILIYLKDLLTHIYYMRKVLQYLYKISL